MKLGKINHIGIVVEDIAEAKSRYSRLFGIKKWWEIVCDGELDLYYHGQKRACQVTLYYGGKGNTKIELIQTRGEENTYTEFFKKRGEGIHHIMYAVKDLDAAIIECKQEGFSVIQNATFKSGGATVRYAYVAKSEDGVIFELVECTLPWGGKKGDMPLELQLGTLTKSYRKVK